MNGTRTIEQLFDRRGGSRGADRCEVCNEPILPNEPTRCRICLNGVESDDDENQDN